LNGLDCLSLLYDVIPFLILKKAQAQKLYDLLMHRASAGQQLENELKAMRTKDAYQAIEVTPAQLSDEYLAGFFDAEGCVRVPA
jgi:hypothetical protein